MKQSNIPMFKLPKIVQFEVLSDWLANVAQLAMLDSALCNKEYRSMFLNLLANPRFCIPHPLTNKYAMEWVVSKSLRAKTVSFYAIERFNWEYFDVSKTECIICQEKHLINPSDALNRLVQLVYSSVQLNHLVISGDSAVAFNHDGYYDSCVNGGHLFWNNLRTLQLFDCDTLLTEFIQNCNNLHSLHIQIRENAQPLTTDTLLEALKDQSHLFHLTIQFSEHHQGLQIDSDFGTQLAIICPKLTKICITRSFCSFPVLVNSTPSNIINDLLTHCTHLRKMNIHVTKLKQNVHVVYRKSKGKKTIKFANCTSSNKIMNDVLRIPGHEFTNVILHLKSVDEHDTYNMTSTLDHCLNLKHLYICDMDNVLADICLLRTLFTDCPGLVSINGFTTDEAREFGEVSDVLEGDIWISDTVDETRVRQLLKNMHL